jgi:hypothetical protein
MLGGKLRTSTGVAVLESTALLASCESEFAPNANTSVLGVSRESDFRLETIILFSFFEVSGFFGNFLFFFFFFFRGGAHGNQLSFGIFQIRTCTIEFT